MEFHLPYMAIRDRSTRDPREIRTACEMLKSLEMESRMTQNDSFYCPAQISFLLTGVDEWHWTAYCCVDTFFGSERNPEWYSSREFDGPSAGGRAQFYPLWNPREYFLFVLSRRLSQATKEWTNVVLRLESRLDEYVRGLKYSLGLSVSLTRAQEVAYELEIRNGQFSYDKDFKKTTRYTWALSVLRRFHDLLMKTLEAWEEFASGELKYFDTESEILDRLWDRHYESLLNDVSELVYLRRSLLQRIQTFDRMKDGVSRESQQVSHLDYLGFHSL